MIPFAILWSIWMERNDRIFKCSSFSSAADLISSIGMRIAKWALVRKEFSNFSLNAILIDWEACMECGPFKLRRFVVWSPLSLGVLKFNVDGAAQRKTGPACIRVVLRNYKGEVLFMFFKNMAIWI